jgi:hypothetical protein
MSDDDVRSIREAIRQLASDMQSVRVNEILAAFEGVARGQNSIAVVDGAAILIGRAILDADMRRSVIISDVTPPPCSTAPMSALDGFRTGKPPG